MNKRELKRGITENLEHGENIGYIGSCKQIKGYFAFVRELKGRRTTGFKEELDLLNKSIPEVGLYKAWEKGKEIVGNKYLSIFGPVEHKMYQQVEGYIWYLFNNNNKGKLMKNE